MLLKPYGVLEEYLDEDPCKRSHVGEILDNNDPEKLGRVKVLIDAWDYMTTEELPWVRPIAGTASSGNANTVTHDVPEIGSQVRVKFPDNNPDDPSFEGVEPNEANRTSLFDEDYPNTHGWKDSAGNFEIHNKKTGISVWHHNSGTTIQMDKDGAFKITGPNGAYAHCDAENNWTFYGAKINLNADDEINLNSTTINVHGANTLNLSSEIVSMEGSTEVNANGGGINLASSEIAMSASRVSSASMLTCGAGASGTIMDLFAKKIYHFQNGILVGIDDMG